MTTKITDMDGVGRIGSKFGNFYEVLCGFKNDGYDIITPQQEMIARINSARNLHIGDSGTYTSSGFEYTNGKMPLLRLKSRLLHLGLARAAVGINSNTHYFSTESSNEYEDALKQAEVDKSKEPWKRQILILPERFGFEITHQKNVEVIQFLAQDKELAERYLEFVGTPIEVSLISPFTVDNAIGTILTQLGFRGLNNPYKSSLAGRSIDLDRYQTVRGVSLETIIWSKNLKLENRK